MGPQECRERGQLRCIELIEPARVIRWAHYQDQANAKARCAEVYTHRTIFQERRPRLLRVSEGKLKSSSAWHSTLREEGNPDFHVPRRRSGNKFRGPIRAAFKANWQEATMKTRIFTYIECPCGHRGALIESLDIGDLADRRHQTRLRNLTRTGTYDGGDALFAEMKPGCPACGRSFGPDDVVGRNELQGTGEVLRIKDGSRTSELRRTSVADNGAACVAAPKLKS
ncbi:hypothetical protein [Paraburkholderia xenovorans]|uniref:hypothetical protein n=1 Tax=Paraburkholderia xenovorans TaxID=36873 RepID=UPI0038B86874